MRPEPYLNVGGTELANYSRTAKYLQTLNTGNWTIHDCGCTETDGAYVSPQADPAPWYTASYPDSARFLGVMLDSIEIDPPSTRKVSPYWGGQRVGVQANKGRIVAISGVLVANTAPGMAYGKRWVSEVLHAADTSGCAGCGLVDLCFLPVCPTVGLTGANYWRTLHNCGLIDGPVWERNENVNEGNVTRFSAQFASEFSYLHGDTKTLLAETTLRAYSRANVSFTVPEWPNDTALKLQVKAGGPNDVTGLRLTVTPDASCGDALDDASLILDARRYSGTGNWNDLTANAFVATPSGGVQFLPTRPEGPYMWFPGATGNHLTSGLGPNYSGEIHAVQFFAHLRLADWTPTGGMILLDKQTSGDLRVNLLATGALSVSYTDGTTSTTLSGTLPLGITDGASSWISFVLTVVNGGTDTVNFYKSNDGITQTLVEQVTATGSNFVRNSGDPFYWGRHASATIPMFAGELFEATLDFSRNSGGDPFVRAFHILPASITQEPPDTIPDSQAGNWTVNRSTSGLYAQYVDSERWMFDGANDYLEIPDSPLLDLTAVQSGTILVAARPRSYAATQALISKKQSHSTADVGWALRIQSTGTVDMMLSDGTNAPFDIQTPTATVGALTAIAGVRNVTIDKIAAYADAISAANVTDTTTGTLANALTFRIGRLSGSGTAYFRGEIYAVAWWQRVLTAAELAHATAKLLGQPADAGPTPCAEWIVDTLPAGHNVTVDGVTGEVNVTEESSGSIVSSLGVFDLRNSRAVNMPIVGHCLTACVSADTWDASINADTTFTVLGEDRDL